MRVVIVNAHIRDRVGGSELQCDLIAQGLAARGHEVHYLAVGGESRRGGSEYAIHDVTHSGSLIGSKCVEIAPDVVYWRYNKLCFYNAARIIASRGIPIVFAVSAVADTEKWGTSGFARRRVGFRGSIRVLKSVIRSRWNYRGFQFVTGLTVNNPEHLNRLPIRRQRYVPNGMIEDSVAFEWDRRYVAWVANIKPGKRPEAFVQLAKLLEPHGVDCLMVGRIQDAGYDWLSRGEGCPPNFHYLGPKSPREVNGILSRAAVHVHTCIPEGFSNVFIQAWLQACPSVSLDFDPGGYMTSQGIGLVAGGDWSLFVAQVQSLLADRERRESMGQGARTFARDTFSSERLVEQVSDLLREVVCEAQSGSHWQVNAT